MLIIQDVLVKMEVVKEEFICNLNACKGACCWHGDLGAPLEREEMHTLEAIFEDVKPFLRPEGIDVLEKKGKYTYYHEMKEFGTPLIEGRDCAYLNYDELGIGKCGIEAAHNAGITDFKKPVSCHLYPLRVEQKDRSAFEILKYDRWDICSPACQLGKKEQVPVYRFVKEALIRKFGEGFYEELDHAAKYLE